MTELFNQINETVMTVELTLEEALELKTILSKAVERDGIPEEDPTWNRCPTCGRSFLKGNDYCMGCGQKIRFTESDIIPL